MRQKPMDGFKPVVVGDILQRLRAGVPEGAPPRGADFDEAAALRVISAALPGLRGFVAREY